MSCMRGVPWSALSTSFTSTNANASAARAITRITTTRPFSLPEMPGAAIRWCEAMQLTPRFVDVDLLPGAGGPRAAGSRRGCPRMPPNCESVPTGEGRAHRSTGPECNRRERRHAAPGRGTPACNRLRSAAEESAPGGAAGLVGQRLVDAVVDPENAVEAGDREQLE